MEISFDSPSDPVASTKETGVSAFSEEKWENHYKWLTIKDSSRGLDAPTKIY